jgi:ATP-dependent Zn protease
MKTITNLRTLLEYFGIPNRDLAQAINVSNWVQGKRPLRASSGSVAAIANYVGYMEHSDEERVPLQTKEALINRIRTFLGGRAAEIIYYGEKDGISTGASGDLETATRVACAMICNYGMDDEFGMAVMSPEEATRDPLAAKVSQRVSGIIKEEMANTVAIIQKNKARLDCMVNALLEKNKLTKEEMEELLKG